MFETRSKHTLQYCLATMLTLPQVKEFGALAGYEGPTSGVKSKLIARLRTDRSVLLTIDTLRKFCMARWEPPPTATHLSNLRSGALAGHSWHTATPLSVHRVLQSKARSVGPNSRSLQWFLEIGGQIAKHEYFMVAIADLCESLIIQKFRGIPPLTSRSLSDFVFRGIPYDLKNTRPTEKWPMSKIKGKPREYAKAMFEGGSTERQRQQAKKSTNNCANNRFFVVVEDELAWERDPESVLQELERALPRLRRPRIVRFKNRDACCHVVTLDG